MIFLKQNMPTFLTAVCRVLVFSSMICFDTQAASNCTNLYHFRKAQPIQQSQNGRSTHIVPVVDADAIWDYTSHFRRPADYLTRRHVPTFYGIYGDGGEGVQEVLGSQDFSPVELQFIQKIDAMRTKPEIQEKVRIKNQWPATQKRPPTIPDDYFECGGFILTLQSGATRSFTFTSFERTQLSGSESMLANFIVNENIVPDQVTQVQFFHNHPGNIPILSNHDLDILPRYSGVVRRLMHSLPVDIVVHGYSFITIDDANLVAGHASYRYAPSKD